MLRLARVCGWIAVAFMLAKPASAADGYRVELKDSTVYENVEVDIDQQFKVVEIKVDTTWITVSFTSIARIIDPEGSDITKEEIGVRGVHFAPNVVGTENTHQPLFDEEVTDLLPPVSRRRDTRPFGATIHLRGAYSTPSGHFYDGFNSGFGVGADIAIPVARRIALRGIVSRSGLEKENLPTTADHVVLYDNSEFSVWRYFACVEFYDWPKWRQGKRWYYYLYSGLGAVQRAASGEMAIYWLSSGDTVVYTAIGQTEFAATSGVGGVYQIARNLGLDFGVSLDLIYYENVFGELEESLIFELKSGLVLIL